MRFLKLRLQRYPKLKEQPLGIIAAGYQEQHHRHLIYTALTSLVRHNGSFSTAKAFSKLQQRWTHFMHWGWGGDMYVRTKLLTLVSLTQKINKFPIKLTANKFQYDDKMNINY